MPLLMRLKTTQKNNVIVRLPPPRQILVIPWRLPGLVSLISLVQTFHHEIIPASLHCERENDYINWKESPFYVNKSNKSWPGNSGKSRTGAVSAFGVSGTNVHMVVQSYCPGESDISREQAPYFLLVFSARTQEALREKIKDMIEVLENKARHGQSLARISRTLLEGRHHFNFRCAIVIRDAEDAAYVLKQVGDKEKLPNLFQGKVSRDFTGQKAMRQYVRDLLKQIRSLQNDKNKYQEILYALAEIYCQGYGIPPNHLLGDPQPDRIHLPTYPFTREHYWIPGHQF